MLSASAAPETGCAITAFKVNTASAITTMRAVAAIITASPVRCAIYMKNAMPSPVPNSTAAPKRWTSLRTRMVVIECGSSPARAVLPRARPADAIEHNPLIADRGLVGDRAAHADHPVERTRPRGDRIDIVDGAVRALDHQAGVGRAADHAAGERDPLAGIGRRLHRQHHQSKRDQPNRHRDQPRSHRCSPLPGSLSGRMRTHRSENATFRARKFSTLLWRH